MTTATARVPTANAAKYLRQLCKHWSHRLEVDLNDGSGTVRFPDAVAKMTATGSEFVVSVEANSDETLDRIKGVVTSHLDRFAFSEAPLPFAWRDA
jgi:hypothetical protein